MRLFLVDSSIFVFRAWYGPNQGLSNRHGEPNQAFVGFADFVYRLLSEQAPSHVVFAFDESLGQSERKRIDPEYKANRSPAPDELKRQFRWCQQWLDALAIARVSSDAWEADDLIASLAHFHRRVDRPLAILTADKDLAQLIEPGDLWWSYLEDKRLDRAAVQKKFGVRPDQIAAQLALVGDKVDNIPGVPQVGPKTAARLLKKFDTLDALWPRLDEVGKMKFRYAAHVQQALLEHRPRVELNLRLTQLEQNLPAMRSVDTRRGAPDADALERMMAEQSFDAPRCRRWREWLQLPASA